MSYVIPAAPISAVPIVDSVDGFPVRRIYRVGRNYATHAREMGIGPVMSGDLVRGGVEGIGKLSIRIV